MATLLVLLDLQLWLVAHMPLVSSRGWGTSDISLTFACLTLSTQWHQQTLSKELHSLLAALLSVVMSHSRHCTSTPSW